MLKNEIKLRRKISIKKHTHLHLFIWSHFFPLYLTPSIIPFIFSTPRLARITSCSFRLLDSGCYRNKITLKRKGKKEVWMRGNKCHFCEIFPFVGCSSIEHYFEMFNALDFSTIGSCKKVKFIQRNGNKRRRHTEVWKMLGKIVKTQSETNLTAKQRKAFGK